MEAVLLTEVATPAGRSLVLKIGDTVFEAAHDPRSDATADRPRQRGGWCPSTGIYDVRSPVAVPAFAWLASLGAATSCCSRRRHGGRSGSSLVLGLFAALTAVTGVVWTEEERQPERPRKGAVPRHPRRAQPPRQRAAARHAGTAAWPACQLQLGDGRQDTGHLAGKGPEGTEASPRRCCAIA